MKRKLIFQDIHQRLVDISDAEFITELRTDSEHSRFLSPTPDSVRSQEEWLSQYKLREAREEEFYFITESVKGEKLGLNRIYNINSHYFEIGSWLFKKNSPAGIAILADLSTRDFGFSKFHVNEIRFVVRKENKSVIRYHITFNPDVIGEDDQNLYFSLSKENYRKTRKQILNIYGTR